MGNKVTKKRVKPKVKSRPTSPENSSIHDLEEVRRSLEPNIGEEIKDCTALFDFPGYHECDLQFKRGDIFHHVRTLKDRDDWLLATHTERRERGFIPRDYVCQDSVPEYYEGFGKRKREDLLLGDSVTEGTYIIKKDGDSYILDVCFEDTASSPSPQRVRKTYKVRQGKDNRVYIVVRKQFDSVTQLLQYYRENADGMCCCLKECLPPPKYTVAARDMDMKEDSFQLGTLLGRGRFGEVFAGTLKDTLPVAVATVDMSRLKVPPNKLAEEIKSVAASFRHHRFVQMLGVSHKKDMFFVVSELVSLGSLRDYLRQDQGQTIHFTQCVDIARQICEGMVYMETQDETFRCLLMCKNILVQENLLIKIKTFPLVAHPYSDVSYRLKWKAPECMVFEDASPVEFTSRSDVWSFGVVMYEIITLGRTPYQEIEPAQFVMTIKSGYKMAKPMSPIEYEEDFWYNTMLICMELKPESRPSFVKLQERFEGRHSRFQQNQT